MISSRILLCLIASLTGLSGLLNAAPLDKEACASVKSEYERLEVTGVEQDMAKGPAWAMANLAPERLDLVRRFIELEELLVFRCRDKTLVTLPSKQELAARRKAARSEKAAARTEAQVPSQWGVTVTRAPQAPPEPEAGDIDTPPPGAFNPLAD